MKTAYSPGKLILSGEHAVVYGAPAIAMAINRYAKATVMEQSDSLISFNLMNLSYHKSMTKKALKEAKHRLNESYESFKRGEHGIKDVIKLPFELSQFAMGHFLEKLNHRSDEGIKITTESDLPIGCGMGSSAAMALAAMHAIAQVKNKALDKEEYYKHALDVENLQHGKSSGLDIRISLQGGCLYFRSGQFESLSTPQFPIYIVNTGHPESSTGECIEKAAPFFKDKGLIEEFSNVTDKLKQALDTNDVNLFKNAIKMNHRLLCSIQVVPQPVQAFVTDLEKNGFAAKICGAGSAVGEKAGIVMIIGEGSPEYICKAYHYTMQKISCDEYGLQ